MSVYRMDVLSQRFQEPTVVLLTLPGGHHPPSGHPNLGIDATGSGFLSETDMSVSSVCPDVSSRQPPSTMLNAHVTAERTIYRI